LGHEYNTIYFNEVSQITYGARITAGTKANNSVEPGIDYINSQIERNGFFVSSECTGVLSEIWDYSRDEQDRIIKVNDHYMDAMRYGIFSAIQTGMILH
ncbi:MAG: hypothetical protein PF518_13125, partial [Spirochaetaceae bacterium]|nr:hypothetical protein [Spirochaetaceae bacterium]